MEWKNAFEEMPPPNVPVLAFIPAYGGGDKSRRIRAMYAPAKTLEVSDDADGGEYDESTDTYYCEAGWYETNEYEDTHWSVGDRVTHWMPLPPPPNASFSREPERSGGESAGSDSYASGGQNG